MFCDSDFQLIQTGVAYNSSKLVSFYCNAIKLHRKKKLSESKTGIFAQTKSHYKFLSLSTLIFFFASCQFSASLTLNTGVLREKNHDSHLETTVRYSQPLQMCSPDHTEDTQNGLSSSTSSF